MEYSRRNAQTISFTPGSLLLYQEICGVYDKNIPIFEDTFKVQIIPRGNTLIFRGDKENVNKCEEFFSFLESLLRKQYHDSGQSIQGKKNKKFMDLNFNEQTITRILKAIENQHSEVQPTREEIFEPGSAALENKPGNQGFAEDHQQDSYNAFFNWSHKGKNEKNQNNGQKRKKTEKAGSLEKFSSSREIKNQPRDGIWSLQDNTDNGNSSSKNISDMVLEIPNNGQTRRVIPKTINQEKYLKSLMENTITIAVGPAGTGKTYLAVAYALYTYFNGGANRLILTRPAVEAGENLGFLPGDLVQKINPYLRPLYDCLFELAGPEQTRRLIDDGTIEIAPLAFMRGRTLSNSFIILDEAQNTTKSQMKMFLTRLGKKTKIAISGDITQIDLDKRYGSGLIQATKIFSRIPGIGLLKMQKEDISRHPLVEKIISAYEEAEKDKTS